MAWWVIDAAILDQKIIPQKLAKPVSVKIGVNQYRKFIISMEVPRRVNRYAEPRCRFQSLPVETYKVVSMRYEFIQMFQLTASKYSMDLAEAPVIPKIDDQVSAAAESVMADGPRVFGQILVLSSDHTTCPSGHDLGWVKRKAGCLGKTASFASLEICAMGVGC